MQHDNLTDLNFELYARTCLSDQTFSYITCNVSTNITCISCRKNIPHMYITTRLFSQ